MKLTIENALGTGISGLRYIADELEHKAADDDGRALTEEEYNLIADTKAAIDVLTVMQSAFRDTMRLHDMKKRINFMLSGLEDAGGDQA